MFRRCFLEHLLTWQDTCSRSKRERGPDDFFSEVLIPCVFSVAAGPIPPELGKLRALQRLYLGDNELSGERPP